VTIRHPSDAPALKTLVAEEICEPPPLTGSLREY
jgi:hypothetical protein